jgi:hypothetical protein
MAPQVLQEPPQKVSHVHGGEVGRLEADIHPHVLALRGHGEGSQRRDAVMFVTVQDDWRLSSGCPRPPTRGDEQKAALIEKCQVGAKSSGFFLSPATCSASSAQSPARRAGWPDAPAPDSSSLSCVTLSRHGRGGSARQNVPEPRRRCAVRSTARWRNHAPWPPAIRCAPAVRIAGPSVCAAARAQVWGPKPPRPLSARLAAIGTQSLPTPAPGVPPGSGSAPVPTARWPGAGAFPMSLVIRKVSCANIAKISVTSMAC